jgi:hypothetical protein
MSNHIKVNHKRYKDKGEALTSQIKQAGISKYLKEKDNELP